MKKEQLIEIGTALFGKHFVTELAQRLGVSDRTVRHWIAEKYNIPAGVYLALLSIVNERMNEINLISERYNMNASKNIIDMINKAAALKAEADNESHSDNPSYNQPLGYHVLTISDSFDIDIPAAKWSEIESIDDPETIIETIKSIRG
ncbi:hypothetical protein [Atlantibacter hermannii]|uniref:hypothetical protein n=1 Tax=Atlantibacter hermannii TaxID=565 RepID=UPI0028A1684C|nr:hypothetical protein [Atlantibacter hermannii]